MRKNLTFKLILLVTNMNQCAFLPARGDCRACMEPTNILRVCFSIQFFVVHNKKRK